MAKINREEYELLKSLSDYWKWIARDKNGRLYKFQEKPKKVISFQWNDRNETWLGMSSDRFQFIQWEDDEPYNIAELIEEYESEETEVKNMKWFKKKLDDIEVNTTSLQNHDAIWMLNRVHELYDQLDEPEVLSQDWIRDNLERKGIHFYVNTFKLQNLLVPKQEVTREQVVEWIGNNEFYCHATAETVLENAVDKGELGYYGTKYSVVKKEPETVADVISDFWKSFERLKEVMSMEVEELEE